MQQWLSFSGLPPLPCPSFALSGCLDMDTEEGFENASFENSEGDTKSESESRPWSESEGTTTSGGCEGAGTCTASEGGESPSRDSRCRTEDYSQKECDSPPTSDKVPLTTYEASRLRNIERNNKRLEDLGLPALASEVCSQAKEEKEKRASNPGRGPLQLQPEEQEVTKVMRSRRAPSPAPVITQSQTKVRFPKIVFILGFSCCSFQVV
jgi:hypothetical protein